MRCKAGKKWGENSYKCCVCGTVQKLQTNNEILKKCSCGNDEFDCHINFKRSSIGFKVKLDEIIRILEVSVFLCEALKLESFYNVIAVQLRIILCDNKEIIKSKLQQPMLHPHTGKIFNESDDFKFILSNDLFDKTREPISLEKWLNQEIAWSESWRPMTIKEVIKAWANKNGGAHVDPSIPEKEMFAITIFGEHYLITIARYIIELLGYDLENDMVEYFFKPYNSLINLH